MAASLHGHEKDLGLLTDDKVMTDARLQEAIAGIEVNRREALEADLGRQAQKATEVLIHMLFEQSQRAGVPAAAFKTSLAERGLVSLEDELAALTADELQNTRAA